MAMTLGVHVTPPIIAPHLLLIQSQRPGIGSSTRAKWWTRVSASLAMDQQQQQQQQPKQQMRRAGELIRQFPHLLAPHRDLLAGLVSAVDDRLGSHLLPASASVPPDVELYQNSSGSSLGCLSINRGLDSSPIDFILTSCLHLTLPTGGTMNITTLQGYLKASTEAPHFVFELSHSSPSYFLLYLDLTPRKDLVLHPDYLKAFYEEGRVEACRKRLYTEVPEAQPYISSSLYFRSMLSPTGILSGIKCEEAAPERVEEILRDHIGSVANDVLGIWMDNSVCKERSVGGEERGGLEGRDRMIKSKAVEMDLSPRLPMLFGQEVADKVLSVIRAAFSI